MQFLTQAYEGGNGRAATYLGILSFFGIAMKEDRVAAENWFESAIKLHDSLAAYNLGSLFSVDLGHPHDLPKAAELLRQAAGAGYVPAMHWLGLLLVNHPELKQDPDQARTLLEAAANAGSWKSSVVLGILARDGRCDVQADAGQAYFHFRLAAIQGGVQAERLIKHRLDTLTAKIGGEESRKRSTPPQIIGSSITLSPSLSSIRTGGQSASFRLQQMADTPRRFFRGPASSSCQFLISPSAPSAQKAEVQTNLIPQKKDRSIALFLHPVIFVGSVTLLGLLFGLQDWVHVHSWNKHTVITFRLLMAAWGVQYFLLGAICWLLWWRFGKYVQNASLLNMATVVLPLSLAVGAEEMIWVMLFPQLPLGPHMTYWQRVALSSTPNSPIASSFSGLSSSSFAALVITSSTVKRSTSPFNFKLRSPTHSFAPCVCSSIRIFFSTR